MFCNGLKIPLKSCSENYMIIKMVSYLSVKSNAKMQLDDKMMIRMENSLFQLVTGQASISLDCIVFSWVPCEGIMCIWWLQCTESCIGVNTRAVVATDTCLSTVGPKLSRLSRPGASKLHKAFYRLSRLAVDNSSSQYNPQYTGVTKCIWRLHMGPMITRYNVRKSRPVIGYNNSNMY